MLWAALPIAAGLAGKAHGASFTWDASGVHPTSPTDGAGSWNSSSAFWSTGSSDIGWTNDGTASAVFGNANGAAGLITVNDASLNINVSNISFNVPGSGNYNITGGAGTSLTLTGATPTINVANGVNPIITTNVLGSSGLTFNGTGSAILILSGTASYNGTTFINSGQLQITNATSNFGSGTVVVASGGMAGANNGVTITNNFNISGSGTSSLQVGALFDANHSITYAGTVTLTGNAAVGNGGFTTTFSNAIVGGTNSINFDGSASGISVFKLSNATANTWAAANITETSSGVANLFMGQSNILPTAAPLTFNVSGTGMALLDLENRAETVAGLLSVGTAANGIVTNAGATTGNLTISPSTSAIFGGSISGVNNVIKTGTGTQTFNGVNYYTGTTAINNGTLSVNGGIVPSASKNANTSSTTTVTITNGTSGLAIGQTISGTGIPTGTVIQQIVNSTSIIISAKASATGNNVALTFAAGSGLGAGAVTVGTSATTAGTLAGTGNISSGVTLAANNGANIATINPGTTGAGSIGTLTLASLNEIGGNLQFDLNTPANSDFLSVTGNANLSSSSAVTVTGQTPGMYTLLTAGTSITGALPTLSGIGSAGSRPATYGYDATSWNGSNSAKSIVIDVSGGAASLVWAGNAAGYTANGADGMTWDNLNGSGGSFDQNWNNSGTAVQDYFYNGDSVTFNDTGTPNYNVSLSTSVSPTAVSFNNSTGNYILSGSGSINGAGSLALNGTGSVTLTNAGSNYSGGTTINNGILNANASSALGTGLTTLNGPGQLNINNAAFGTGHLTINGGTIDNTTGSAINVSTGNLMAVTGSFTFAGSSNLNLGTGAVTLSNNPAITVSNHTLTIGGNIGTGTSSGLTKAGNGTLVLSGVNTYTGTTNISAGTVVATNSSSLGAASGAGVIINGGTLDVGGDPTSNNLQFNVTNSQGLSFTIAGTGAGAIGAVTNSNASTPQFNTFRGNNVSLSADALISGNRIDIGRDATAFSILNLNNHTLTLSMSGSQPMFGLENHANVSAGNIVVAQGTLDIESSALVLDTAGTSTITYDSGADAQFFQTVGADLTRPMIFDGNNTIGSGSGTAAATANSPMTLLGNVTLEAVSNGIPSLTALSALTLAGNIAESGGSYAVTKSGASTVTLSGSNSWSGGSFVQDGTLLLASNTSLPAGTAVTLGGSANVTSGTLDLGGFNATVGGLTVATGAGAANVIGNSGATPSTLSYAGGTSSYSGVIKNNLGTGTSTVALNVSSGSLTFTGSNTFTGGTYVAGATLKLSAAGAFPAGSNLNISSGGLVVATTLGTRTAIQVGSLVNTGAMDLQNNGLVVHSGTIGAVNTLLGSGFNSGAWNGSAGIYSTTAAGNASHLTALGSMINDTGANANASTGLAIYNTMNGVPTVAGDILVKYTYYGDANLSGVVDGSDYSLIDNGYLNKLTGWFNGDFNYDNVVDGSDYTLIDNAYNSQGAAFTAEIASPTAELAGSGVTSAVPEPAALGLLGIAAIGLLGRRRRSHTGRD